MYFSYIDHREIFIKLSNERQIKMIWRKIRLTRQSNKKQI